MDFYSEIKPNFHKLYEKMFAELSPIDPNFWTDSFINGWYIPGTAESARRYYSAKQFLHTIGPLEVRAFFLVCNWQIPTISEQSNYVPRPDNKHFLLYSLKQTLRKYVNHPIKTIPYEKDAPNEKNPSNIKKGPRLLLVTVDVKTGDAVTFDSYSKSVKYNNDKNIIYHPEGIDIEHLLATGAFPDFFDYPKFNVNVDGKKEDRIFWDGGFRSNTPLRDVLQAHRDYWLAEAGYHKQKEYQEEFDNVLPDLRFI